MTNIWKIGTTRLIPAKNREDYLRRIAEDGFVACYGVYVDEELPLKDITGELMNIQIDDIVVIYKGGRRGWYNTIYRIGEAISHRKDSYTDQESDGCHYIIKKESKKDYFDGRARHRVDVKLWEGKEYEDIPLKNHLGQPMVVKLKEKDINNIKDSHKMVRDRLLGIIRGQAK